MVAEPEADVRFAAELRFFLAPRHRDGQLPVACDGVSSLGHVVYWHGAHGRRLDDIVDSAIRAVAASRA